MRRNGGFTRRDLMRAAAALGGAAVFPARGAEPVRLGFTMSLTGGTAPNGKQLLASIELWRDDVNARGGLLGRPVQLVYYDDQSNPATVPGLYTKLLDVDKVDLVIGPYSTNMVAPAMPVLMQREMTTVSILALAANSRFHYPRYFSMIPAGPNPKTAFSSGFFTLAAAQNPRPKTVAIIAADAEFARNSADGARENAQSSGFSVVYDRTYPPSTVEFGSLMRAVQAASADLVYVASYPPDTVGIVRAANEVRLEPKMFGGTLIGLLATPFKMQLGPLANGIVNSVSFIPAPKFDFPGNRDLLRRYQEKYEKEAYLKGPYREVIRNRIAAIHDRYGLNSGPPHRHLEAWDVNQGSLFPAEL